MAITQDVLNKELSNLGARIDSRKLASDLGAVADKFIATTETKAGKTAGAIEGGILTLTEVVDNDVDKIDTVAGPVVGKIVGGVPDLTNIIEASDLADIDTLTGGVGLSQVFADVGTQVDNVAVRLDEIIGSVDPESIAAAMRGVFGNTEEELAGIFATIGSSRIVVDLEAAVKEALGGAFFKQVGDTLSNSTKQFREAVGGFSTNNILKTIVENKSGGLQSSVQQIVPNISSGVARLIAADMLAGRIDAAKNRAYRELPIPADMAAIGEAKGIRTPVRPGKNEYNRYIADMHEADGDNPVVIAGIAQLRIPATRVEDKITVDVTKTTNQVSQGNPTIPANNNAVSSPETAPMKSLSATSNGRPNTLNSVEETVKLLQAATREITSVVVHWTAHFNDQYYVGAKEIDDIHRHPSVGFNEIGYHFVIKRDGTIDIGRNINKIGAHAAGFNTYSIGIAFVAGYNCTSATKNPSKYISAKSITQAQWTAFNTFMEAYYRVFPGGEAWGHIDIDRNDKNNRKIDPGFDVPNYVANIFGKVNLSSPPTRASGQSGFLSKAELKTLANNRGIG